MAPPDKVPLYPFDDKRLMGTVYKVSPSKVDINLPYAAANSRALYGSSVECGAISELVIIACGEFAILAEITEIRLPERERLQVREDVGTERHLNPLGSAQLLATISLDTCEVFTGIIKHPRLASPVYSASPELIEWIIARSSRLRDGTIVLPIGRLPQANDLALKLKPEQLFGRHCAVLGTTGGGKSWTTAMLVEQAASHGCKIILLDATGEFCQIGGKHTEHLHVGEGTDPHDGTEEAAFPYTDLTERDLFALFTPSGQAQVPKLRDAIRSLKLAKCEPDLATNGVIIKAEKSKCEFRRAYKEHVESIESPSGDFDIRHLSRQIEHECVWPSGRNGNDQSWGGFSNDLQYCIGLQMRIDSLVKSKHLAFLLDPGTLPSVSEKMDSFFDLNNDKRILRLALQDISYEAHAREIIINVIGRTLLSKARENKFRKCPLVVFMDEGHQFLGKSLGDETNRMPLDAFGLIAKEGRKYGLTVCIATQRPRDLPEDVFSQIGTFIVHRLTNDRDRSAVERACGEIDRSASELLPTLRPGEAIIVGVDFPVPLSVMVNEPASKPDSSGPDYQKHWQV